MDESESGKNQGNPPFTSPIEKVTAIKSSENTGQKQCASRPILEHMQDKWRKGWERWKRFSATEKLTGLLVLLTVFYTSISLWQGCQMRNAVNVARDTLTAGNRPWVGVSGTEPLGEMIPGEPFRVRVRLKNVGHSPGLHVEIRAYLSPLIGRREIMGKVPFMDMSTLPPCVQPKPQWDDRTNGNFILPGENERMWIVKSTPHPMNETTIKFVKGRESDDPVVSKEEFEQFPTFFRIGPKDFDDPSIRKTVGLYLVGCINYFDEFAVAHRTTFCFRYEHAMKEEDRGFSMCEYGHDAD
jgi:hypothetical protein